MSEPNHHIPDAMLAAQAAGALPYPFAVLVAAHVSLCDDCRARLGAHEITGGLVLEDLPPAPLRADARHIVLAALDGESLPARTKQGAYPVPIGDFLDARGPRWSSLGFGAKQAILWRGTEGSLRLLSIPAGQAVPDHGHHGMELTLVLSGAFSDVSGLFQAGDVEVADEDLDHAPTATKEGPCICVAATDAPLRFHALLPRLLRPIFRI